MLSRRMLFAALGLALPVASAEAATSRRKSTGKSHAAKTKRTPASKHATTAKPKRAHKAELDSPSSSQG